MRDVESSAGKRFRRRPLEPVPREVEQADRHASIDDRGAIEIAGPSDAILPRAREEREIHLAYGAAGGVLRQERPAQPIHVFAHAARLAERGAVIEKDAHPCLSLSDSVSYIST